MSEAQKLQITKAVLEISSNANVSSDDISKYLETLLKMNIDDALDNILTTLNYQLYINNIRKEDIFKNIDLLLNIYPEKYNTTGSLVERLTDLKKMNLDHPQMSLEDNHKLVLEVFKGFNNLIGTNMDAYYTGGLVGYLSTKQELVRYHGDLDLVINEKELYDLKKLVNESDDFKFVDNLHKKESHGHEYIITYKDTPMSIGLFLFERDKDGSIINKEYYYDHKEFYVDKTSMSLRLSNMYLDNNIHIYDGTEYKMISLEYIYNQKKQGRPKDIFDAEKLERYVDKEKVSLMNKISSYDIKVLTHQDASDSIVSKMENKKQK